VLDTSAVSISATITQVAEAFALPESAVVISSAEDLLPDLLD
jgi:hypothetical protein